MKRLFASIAVVCLMSGCTNRQQDLVVDLADEPIEYDEAMLLRNWQRTEAIYASGGVEAGPTYFSQEYAAGAQLPETETSPGDDAGRRRSLARVLDPLIFLGNVAALPVRMIQTPPWRDETSRDLVIPPTYHAAPPLPEPEVEVAVVVVEVPDRDEADLPATIPATRPATAAAPATRPVTRTMDR